MLPSPPNATAAIVLRAAQAGTSLCIPGTREMRVGHETSSAPEATGVAPPVAKDASPPSDPERREYQLAGGGAPGERGSTRRASVIERLLRFLR